MGWDTETARKTATRFIAKMAEMGFVTSYDGSPITNEIIVDTEISTVGAFRSITRKGWGLGVTDLFTHIVTIDEAIWFVLGHELSHLFLDQWVEKTGWNDVREVSDEIVADLMALYVLVQIGYSWDAIIDGVTQEQTNVFNSLPTHSRAGQHRIASERIAYMRIFKELVLDSLW